ncbi:MAG: transglycosylase domain-containing protein, partial [Bacteroidota bacterium]|nr:transglycosylase domain-containing protein [Bacteroidota bacterium]
MSKKDPEEKKQGRDFRRIVLWFWILVACIPLSVFLGLFLAWAGAFGPLPTFEEIENPKSNLASQIISSDGVLIGKYYAENRTHAEFNEISPYVINALVATEDERYYDHSGIDFRGLARAIAFMGKKGGASTITQQLAKNLFNEPTSSLVERIKQKLKEWVIALQIERQYTKDEIIAMYLNQFDFLYQAVGINSAARIYFNTTPDSLKIHEAALLVGMVKNPSYYNPRREESQERTLGRRNQVFHQMERNGLLTQEEVDSLSQLPLGLDYTPQSHIEGLAPYFREYLRSYMKDWLEEHPKPDGSKYNLYTDGLKIYTTIDSRMQAHAEKAVQDHMANVQRVFFMKEKGRKQAPFHNLSDAEIDALLKQAMRRTPRYRGMKARGVSNDSIDLVFNTPIPMEVFSWKGEIDTVMSPMDSIRYYKFFYHAGLMSVEPQTGFVKAWVGGINYKHFKYDHVIQGARQVGSTFKPFVYATAIKQKHYSPCMEVPNVRTCIEKGMFDLLEDWCPSNSDNEYGGVLTLKDALAQSKNTVTTFLMKQIGPSAVAKLARDMGVKSEIPIQPSIALGSVDLKVYEMVGSYTTFANKGVYTEPIMVLRIEDKNGIVLDEFTPLTREVMSEEDAYVVTNLLTGVTENGTGKRLRFGGKRPDYEYGIVTGFPWQFENQIAGKTGTTQNQSDGWFMGMVPNLITGVWTGCEDRSAHFGSITFGQGATTALPIWANYMKAMYADKKLKVSQEPFERPEGELSIELDCAAYKRKEKQDAGNPFDQEPDEFQY